MAALFQNSFLPFAITEWNNLNSYNKNIDSYTMFRKKAFNFYKTFKINTYGIYDLLGVRFKGT